MYATLLTLGSWQLLLISLQISEALLSQISAPDIDRGFADYDWPLGPLNAAKGWKTIWSCRAKLNLIKISAITGFIRNKIHRKIQ